MTLPCSSELIAHFRTHDKVRGVDTSRGFAYDLDLGKPWLATAIHAGHNLRAELLPQVVIPVEDRQREEDTATDQIIQACASNLWGLDSRAEYDLNRAPESAIPVSAEMFWGVPVYQPAPDEAMIRHGVEKYEKFYSFMGSLLTVLLERHGACVVYDVHSYNIQRQVAKGHPGPPVFNVGTRLLNHGKWRGVIESWLYKLAEISIPGCDATVAENDVFGGQGEFCRRLTQWDTNILVLPTEIAKVYMDEQSGVVRTTVVEALKQGLCRAVDDHGQKFQENHCV